MIIVHQSVEFVEKPCTNFIFCTFPEKDGSSSEEQSESDEEDGFKNSSNKIGEEISVTDLLEKAKQQEFKVCFKYASFFKSNNPIHMEYCPISHTSSV